FSAVLAAGMDGIEKNLDPGEPVDWNVYETPDKFETLPSNLKEAIEEARNDDVLRRSIGEELYDSYLEVLEEEWAEFSRSVTDWELRKYLFKV
ncbi:MAG TPA: glutamine synthetase, partial [Candidatus Korarchaeota archaeon]|nr:glutamine synthetase [Candidatus Korarchaeota archaeon]